ncbi:hypothetical protein [Williamsia herbipolensis]|uniref:hypothetical protein n=1 Tax=Williamsia herbipolensis TaxID=1603258 RepID=UPI0005F7F61D|nr:hypothetical protein [Williamsia herbipolensis]
MTNRTQIEFEMPDLTDPDPAAEAVLRELAEVHQPMAWRELRPLLKGLSRTRRQALLGRLIGEGRITWTCLRPGADVVMINSRPILERAVA